eukprot:3932748-Rhodomonas_salina.1
MSPANPNQKVAEPAQRTGADVLADVPQDIKEQHSRMRKLPQRPDALLGELPSEFDVIATTKLFLAAADRGAAGIAAAEEEANPSSGLKLQRRVRAQWEKKANSRRIECILNCMDAIPNIMVFFHVLLQGGVQTNTLKGVVKLSMKNGKLLETEAKPLATSLRMVKALENNLEVYVAPGLPAQVAWADVPKPFKTFEDMVSAAGGTLANIVPLHELESHDEQGYKVYLRCRDTDLSHQYQAEYLQLRSKARHFGVVAPPEPPRAFVPEGLKVQEGNKTLSNLLESQTDEERESWTTDPFSGHHVTWHFPFLLWGLEDDRGGERLSKRARRRALLQISIERIRRTAQRIRWQYARLQLSGLLESEQQTDSDSSSEDGDLMDPDPQGHGAALG